MEPKYTSESDVIELVRSFEDASIARGEWKHAEHLVVALYYLTRHDFETAYAKMLDGILNLLVKGFHPHDKILKAISLPAHPLRPQNARLRMLMPSFGG